MEWTRPSPTLTVALVLACGSDSPTVVETDAPTETGTAGSSGDPGSTTGPAPTAPDASAGDSTGGSTGPGTTTGSEGSGTTDDCPVGTEGCPCDEGQICDEGLVCGADDQCEPAPPCRPIDTEPHDDEATAITIGELNCGDMLDLGTLGTLEGPQTDWYRFFGDEGFILCAEQPQVTITADVDTEVCVFIECLEGNAIEVGCAGGSTASDSPEGRPGCCGVGEGHLDTYDCSGFLAPKNVNVWVSVATAEAVCTDYDFVYSF